LRRTRSPIRHQYNINPQKKKCANLTNYKFKKHQNFSASSKSL
jgi:hypothetical protein